MAEFESLEKALEPWFGKPFSELPDDLREKVAPRFRPVTWDALGPKNQRHRAQEVDASRSPDDDGAFERQVKLFDIEQKIRAYETAKDETSPQIKTKHKELERLRTERGPLQEDHPVPGGKIAAPASVPETKRTRVRSDAELKQFVRQYIVTCQGANKPPSQAGLDAIGKGQFSRDRLRAELAAQIGKLNPGRPSKQKHSDV